MNSDINYQDVIKCFLNNSIDYCSKEMLQMLLKLQHNLQVPLLETQTQSTELNKFQALEALLQF